jgi:hypothetical protein
MYKYLNRFGCKYCAHTEALVTKGDFVITPSFAQKDIDELFKRLVDIIIIK